MSDKFEAWSVGTRVYMSLNKNTLYATVVEVTPHESGNPWLKIESDKGSFTTGTQMTLMKCGIKKVDKNE